MKATVKNIPQPVRFLDITADVCPMTYVRTRLLVEEIEPGEVIEVRLAGEEPLRNVPDSLSELGHVILSLTPEDEQAPDSSPWRLRVRKSAP